MFSIACMACFRTRVALDTARVFAHMAAAAGILDDLGHKFAAAYPDVQVSCPLSKAQPGGKLYASLADSSSAEFSTPLWVVDRIGVDAATDAACGALLERSGGEHFMLGGPLTLYLYDNTVAILEWQLRARDGQHAAALRVSPRLLDELTSALSERLVQGLASRYVDWLTQAVAAAHRQPRHASTRELAAVVRNPEHLALFFDAGERGRDSGVLWTSRTAVAPCFEALRDGEPFAWYGDWAEGAGEHVQLAPHCDCRISWGNSAIAGADCNTALPAFLAVKRRLQFFYATTTIHNRNVTELLVLGFLATGKSARKIVRQHRLIRANLQYSESLIFDTELGLQGNNYKVYRAFFEQWRFRQLLEGTQRKEQLAAATIGERLTERRLGLQRNLKALLVALSAIEALGVVIALVELADGTSAARRHWGILRLVSNGSPDTIVTIAVALLAILAALIVWFGMPADKQ